MVIREMISTFYALIGDIGEKKVQRGEVVRYLNDAQDMHALLLANIVRERFLTMAEIALVKDQELYELPDDFQDPNRVTMHGHPCNRIAVEDLDALDRNTLHEAVEDSQQWYYLSGGSGYKTLMGLRPIPPANEAAGLKLWYYRTPIDFRHDGYVKGTVSAAVDATEFNDLNILGAGAAAKVGQDDLWNNAILTFTKGLNMGISRRVLDFQADDGGTYGQFTVDSAFPNIPVATDEFWVEQTSIIPREYHHVMVLYAASLGASKAGADQGSLYGRWEKAMAAVTMRHTDNVDVVLPGEPGKPRAK